MAAIPALLLSQLGTLAHAPPRTPQPEIWLGLTGPQLAGIALLAYCIGLPLGGLLWITFRDQIRPALRKHRAKNEGKGDRDAGGQIDGLANAGRNTDQHRGGQPERAGNAWHGFEANSPLQQFAAREYQALWEVDVERRTDLVRSIEADRVQWSFDRWLGKGENYLLAVQLRAARVGSDWTAFLADLALTAGQHIREHGTNEACAEELDLAFALNRHPARIRLREIEMVARSARAHPRKAMEVFNRLVDSIREQPSERVNRQDQILRDLDILSWAWGDLTSERLSSRSNDLNAAPGTSA